MTKATSIKDDPHALSTSGHDSDRFVLLGEFEFLEDSTITVSTAGADGYVVIDAVRWLVK